MATRKNLKAFVRLDGSHNVVPGSLVLRTKQPKQGRWLEIQSNICCTTTTTTTVEP